MAIVTFVDETTAGERSDGWELEVAEERLTARELLRRRVFHDVAAHNAHTPQVFQGLVQPLDTERVRNGYGLRTPRRVDAESQADLALRAFLGNGLLMLVGERQITDPDEEIECAVGTQITFLKLVPLVGG